jgi:hypothetical protein
MNVTEKVYNEHEEVDFPNKVFAPDGALQADYSRTPDREFEMTVVTYDGISQAETSAVVGSGGTP